MEVLLSRYSRNNAEQIYQALQGHHAAGTPAYLLVPEQATLQHDVSLLAHVGAEALLTIQVKSFASLAREVLSLVGGIRRPLLTETGKAMLLGKVLQTHQDTLRVYGQNTANRGFAAEVVELISDLKRGGIVPTDLLAAEAHAEPLLARKLADLGLIYQAYLTGMAEAVVVDGEDRLAMLAEAISEATYLSQVHIYLLGFHGFSQLEYEVIGALDQAGVPLTIALTLPEAMVHAPEAASVSDQTAFAAALATYRALQKRSQQPVVSVADRGPSPLSVGLEHMSRGIFSYSPEAYPGPCAEIAVARFTHTEDEVEQLAVTIRRQVIETGARYRDFSVLMTEASEYAGLIKRIFRAYKIPFFIDERRAYAANPLVRFILLALEMAASRLSNDAVFSFLKSGLVAIDLADAYDLENYAAKRKLHHEMLVQARYFVFDEAYYAAHPRQASQARLLLAGAERARSKLAQLFLPFYQGVQKKATVRSYAEQVYGFFRQADVLAGWANFQQKLAESGEVDLLAENDQVWSSFVDLLDEMVDMLGHEEMDFAAFAIILGEGFGTKTIGIIPPAQDQVVVGTITRSRRAVNPYVFVLGMNDAYIPKTPEGATLFHEGEKKELAAQGLVLPSQTKQLTDDLYQAIYEVFTGCSGQLCLSYAMLDVANTTLRPSRLVLRILEMFPEVVVAGALQNDPHEVLPYSPTLAFQYSISTLGMHKQGGVLPAAEVNLALALFRYWQGAYQGHAGFASGIGQGLFSHKAHPPLHQELAQALFGGPKVVSISRMETFAACPYKHFVRYGLRPEEAKQYEIDVMEIGNILHESIDGFTKDLAAQKIPLPEITEENITELLEERFASAVEVVVDDVRRGDARNAFVLGKVRKNAHKVAKRVTQALQQGAFVPYLTEADFGRGGPIPPITLQIGGETIYLEGRIDRIDRFADADGDYLRIIDYKSGNKTVDISRIYHGLDVQLVVYLKAVLGIDGSQPAGAFYLPMADHLIEQEGDDPEVLAQALLEQLLLEGIVIKDTAVLQAIDRDIDVKSSVLKLYGRKRTVGEKDNVWARAELDRLMDHVMAGICQDLAGISQGDIGATPFLLDEGKAVACGFCDFRGLCRFDERYDGYAYRRLNNISWAGARENLSAEEADVNG